VIAIATLALILAAPPAPAVCVSAEDPALRARIEPLLGTIDRPVEPEQWRRLPPEARAVLEAIASDPSELPTRRAAALAGVTALGGDGALHQKLAADAKAPFVVRHRALAGLGELLPAAKRTAVLQPFLRDDPDRRVRAAAAEVLAGSSPADGCGAVRAQAQRETTDARFKFKRALAACEGK
jgi:hypothetical protein